MPTRQPPRETGLRAALRRPARPEGGMRVAYSYAAAVVATLVGIPVALSLVNGWYDAGRICPDDESLACPTLWLGGSVAAALAVLLAAGAWVFRLGWRWWLAGAALALLLVEVVVDPFSPWLLLGMVIPGIAAVLSDPGLGARRARTIAVVAVAVVAMGWLVSVFSG